MIKKKQKKRKKQNPTKRSIDDILKQHPEWLPPQVPITDAFMESRYGKPTFSVRRDDGTLEHWYRNK